MSVLFRPSASLPLPFNFGPKIGKDGRSSVRTGVDSLIHNHASFRQIVGESGLSIPPMATRYWGLRLLSPKKVFLVDFESVWRSERALPRCTIEVKVRNGNSKIVISCIFNEEGVTNSDFEDDLVSFGYTNKTSYQGVRRIRGPSQFRTPLGCSHSQCSHDIFARRRGREVIQGKTKSPGHRAILQSYKRHTRLTGKAEYFSHHVWSLQDLGGEVSMGALREDFLCHTQVHISHFNKDVQYHIIAEVGIPEMWC